MEFGILGPVEATSGGQRLELGRTKQRALLARLLISANQVVSADRLIDDLWAGQPPPDGPGALQIQVARLRRVLAAAGTEGQQVLATRKPGYVLRVADGSLDAARFATLVAEGRRSRADGEPQHARQQLTAALQLWRGPALADFADEPFARAEAARLEELRLVAVEERVEAELELGAHAAVVGPLRQLVGEHPARERLWGQLMLALYRSGRQAEALRTYGEVRRWLGEELGIEPSAALRELEEAVLLQKAHVDWVPPASPVATVRPEQHERSRAAPLAAERAASPLVGRSAPYRRLCDAWERAASEGPTLALVTGEPGVGKTRLVAELADRAGADGALVLLGRCDEELAVPYQPFADALAPVVAALPPERLLAWLGGRAGELVRLLPQLGDLLPDLPPPLRSDPETEAFRLLEAVTAALAGLAAQAPVLLVLDDLHWAARPTLVLLRHLLLRGAPMPLLAVGTVRDTEPGRVPDVIGGLGRDGRVVEVALAGLDEHAVGDLVASLGGGGRRPGPPIAAAPLHAATAGNPLFVREVVRDLLERGGDHALRPPEGVQAVVRQRLARLSDHADRLLGLAAVIGVEYELAVLADSSRLTEDELLTGLEEAMGAGIVGDVPGLPLRQRFTHAVVKDALYEGLPAARRAVLHGRVGEAVERTHAGRLGEHLPELARHFGRAGGRGATRKAIAYSRQAADRALHQLADDEAVSHYREALRLAELVGRDDLAETTDLLLGLGAAQRRQGDPQHRQTLLDAAGLAARLDDPARMATAALASSRGFWSASGTVDHERVAALEAALTRIGDGATPLRARLLANLAVELVWAGDLGRVRLLSDQAVAMARSLDDLPTLAAVLAPRFNAIRGDPGTLPERLADTAELLAVAEQLPDPSLRCEAWGWRAVAALEAADADEAARSFATFDRLAAELRQPTLLWYSAYLRCSRELMAARFDDAERSALEAYQLGHSAGHPDAEMFLLAQGIQLAFERGHLDAWEGGLLDAIGRQPGSDLFLRSWQALLLCEVDRDDEARACFDALAAQDFADLAFEPVWLHIVANCASVCAHLGDARRATLLLDLLRPYEDQLVTMCSLACSGAVALHLGRLAATTGDLDEAESQLVRATTIHDRMGAPAWSARSRLALGEVLLAAGDPDRADDALELLRQAAGTAGDVGAVTVERRARRRAPPGSAGSGATRPPLKRFRAKG